ncbi:hypothetical protein ACQ0P8_15415 [Halodesulfovibrio aestuarii]|uniref:Microcystin-dependent protein n=1 Tax=Halodesulfovibrio aestuarii TaxID=126333 RepID=A0A8G2FBW4_9BACT|nr:hypothetical protein [Halodesulfovibrio aestuarii]SHJ46994.1 Microcystin-dependent protein [Halodesulfovibrio aestuarii]
MTISSQRTIHRYVGDGAQDKWPVLFRFLEPEHVKAIRTSVDGVDIPLVYGAEYSVEVLEGGGGRCVAALAQDEQITLFLDVPLTQETDLRNAGKLSAEAIERMSDKLTLALQQQREDLERCVQVPTTSSATPEQLMQELTDSASTAVSAKEELTVIKEQTLQLKNESAAQVGLAASEVVKAQEVVSDAAVLVSDAQSLIKSAQNLIEQATGDSGNTAVEELLSGMVIPFNGTVNSAGHPVSRMTGAEDVKYALCDGRTYAAPDGAFVVTPDLRDKFIAGAGKVYAQGETGGSNTVELTVAQLPAHSHSIRAYKNDGTTTYNDLMTSARTTTAERNVSESGGSEPHENRPPFYALAYLMKL